MRVLAAAVVAIAAAATPHAPQQRFKARSELVTIDALVTHDRRIVIGLNKDDFEVLDNGIPQAVEQLYVEQLPLNVIMVLDTSGSVRGERLEFLKQGAAAVIDRLRARDRAAVISFSAQLELYVPLTDDRTSLRDAVRRLKAEGGTALTDATFAGLALRGAAATRTLVLVFSDGVDTASFLGEDRVLEVARRSDATVYAIGIREQPRFEARSGKFARIDSPWATDDRFLTAVARETGGRLVYAQQNRELAETFARVIEEFNSRYVLGYAPRGVPGRGWHQVTVRLKNRSGTVLARRGYFAD